MMLERIQQEFRWSQFRYHYERPLDFAVWSVRDDDARLSSLKSDVFKLLLSGK